MRAFPAAARRGPGYRGARGRDITGHFRTNSSRKRYRLCDALADAGLSPCVPQGAYYVLADMSRVKGTHEQGKGHGLP